jgi:dATP pyrophosphohydrolase
MPKIKFNIVEVVVFRTANDPEFLVLRRSDDDDIYPGLWQIVSGGIRRGEKAYCAAVREIEEEIGIKPSRVFNTPLTNTFYVWTTDSVNVSPVLAAEVNCDAVVKLSEEHQEFRWLRKEQAISLLIWPGQREAIEVVDEYILRDNPSRKFMEIKIR